MSLKLRLKQDYPSSTEVVHLDGSVTVDALIEVAKEKFGRGADFVGYGVVSGASYGEDVVQLNLKELSTTLVDAGLVDEGTVCFFVSDALKPKQAVKLVEEKEEEDDTLEEEGKYKGFSARYCVRDFAVETDEAMRALKLEYLLTMSECLIEKDYERQVFDLKVKDLEVLISNDKLDVPESEIFNTLLRWGAKRTNQSTSLKTVIAPLLTHIRIPLLEATAVATAVIPADVLDETQILDLFTFIGRRGSLQDCEVKEAKERLASTAVPKSLSMFTATMRSSARGGSWSFEKKGASDIVKLTKNSKVATHSGGSNQWASVRVTRWIKAKTGIHKIKFKIVDNSKSHWIFLGFVHESYSGYTNTSGGYVGNSGSTSSGWTSASNGTRYGSTSGQYGPSKTPAFASGDTVIMVVNSSKQTVSFTIQNKDGKKDWGVAFQNVTFPLAPAVTLYDGGDQVQLV